MKHGHSPDRAFLFSQLQQSGTVLLESSRQDPLNTKHLLFHSPVEILTVSALDEIPELFRRIEHYRSTGHWIAGYAGYECGYHFDTILPTYTHSGPQPLAWFGVYAPPAEITTDLLEVPAAEGSSSMKDPRLTIDEHEYQRTIQRLKDYIENGDTYQVNFTDRFEFAYDGTPHELYVALRRKQHVPFSAFLNLGTTQILSFSPELFFRIDGSIITTKPMKGTCKRGKNSAEDHQLSRWLQNDEKNRSENLMIVDLLRNDIGRICENGSVQVSDMYAIEKYETVLQMTSTVSGRVKKNVPYYDIFKALFPCGSVTGAPKIRTMQIINELEKHSRGVYCGAIGFIAPDDRSVFSVAIRTITLSGGKGTMGVGSGIVYDSEPGKEYEECRLKAAFLLNEQPEFQLLETLLWKQEYTFLTQHIARLKASADYFHIPFSDTKILDALQLTARSLRPEHSFRIRLLLSRFGVPTVEATEYSIPESSTIKIALDRTRSEDLFLYHKTTNRTLYDRYRNQAANERIADYIFLNERDEITEGSVTNIFVETDGNLFTPPLQCGLLPGIYRGQILQTNSRAVEKIITLNDLRTADVLYICNSVRGLTKVTLSE